ncbi:MAG TPA: hypothetical protein VEW93_15365 [Acidimicrobiales bacterium]|nr:hypothetical protein [Acidimicrobiales bacterium]
MTGGDGGPGTGPGRPGRPVLVVALVGLAAGALWAGIWFGTSGAMPEGPGDPLVSSLYEPPSRPVEVVLNARDGQVFATQAVDPLGLRSERIRGGPAEEAYRYQRPAYGWIGWAASGGRAGAVPWALVAVTVASVGALVGALAWALARSGVAPGWALVVLVLPGVTANLTFVGPESLGAALAVLAVARARRTEGIPWDAVALAAAAGLCRETLLLVPAALALVALARRRPARAGALAASALPYGVWVVALRVGIGAWPRGSVGGRLSPVPFGGLWDRAGEWTAADGAVIASVLVLGGVGLARAAEADLRAVLGVHMALAAVLGPAVWARPEDVGRVLLPLAVVGLWALLAARARPAPVDPDGVPEGRERTFGRQLDDADRLAPCPTLSSSVGPASTTSGVST